jgi:hypothetical protein
MCGWTYAQSRLTASRRCPSHAAATAASATAAAAPAGAPLLLLPRLLFHLSDLQPIFLLIGSNAASRLSRPVGCAPTG